MKDRLRILNARICKETNIESIFLLLTAIKDEQTAFFKIEMNDVKIANMLIEKKLVFDHILRESVRYNLACKWNNIFNVINTVTPQFTTRKPEDAESTQAFMRLQSVLVI